MCRLDVQLEPATYWDTAPRARHVRLALGVARHPRSEHPAGFAARRLALRTQRQTVRHRQRRPEGLRRPALQHVARLILHVLGDRGERGPIHLAQLDPQQLQEVAIGVRSRRPAPFGRAHQALGHIKADRPFTGLGLGRRIDRRDRRRVEDGAHQCREIAQVPRRDLAALVGAILDASAITPINAAAKAQPSERTIRFYVTKGLVSPPEGRGTAATYSYRHFLQLLWIKLRQMDRATLATITKDMQDHTGDVLERRAAQTLGASLPVPDRLPLRTKGEPPRGKSGRVLTAWMARDAEREPDVPSSWRRIPVGRGLELHVEAAHPLARLGPDEGAVADAVRQALAKLMPHGAA